MRIEVESGELELGLRKKKSESVWVLRRCNESVVNVKSRTNNWCSKE